LLVKAGERVVKGQIVAEVGSTGRSTGPHLHYEIRLNGNSLDPRKYLHG
jgi:murein DD-endopeptidase MepM/ murein hydrolase activator NlpD